MKEELINKAYEIAKERYAAVGVDTEKVMETMQNFHLSLHCNRLRSSGRFIDRWYPGYR